jgi:hypothetical protein
MRCHSGKICHSSERAAKEFRKQLRTKGSRMRIYLCPHCRYYHLTKDVNQWETCRIHNRTT